MIASIFYCVVVVHVLVIILGGNFSDSVSCVNHVCDLYVCLKMGSRQEKCFI